MYHCIDCDRDFDEPAQYQEYRGECHGTPAYETVYACPICGGDFETKEVTDYEC